MKKRIVFISALLCVLALFGCSRADAEQEAAASTENAPLRSAGSYSFSGENEFLRITNGSILVEDTNESFDGGDLEILQPDLFADVTSYTATFYTLRNNGQRNDFSSAHTTDVTDGADSIYRDLSGFSGNGYVIVNLEQGLWFELIAADADGTEHTYLLELTVTKTE